MPDKQFTPHNQSRAPNPASPSPEEEANAKVLVYTDQVLSGSATFIRAQAEKVTAHDTLYVGTKTADVLDVPAGRKIVINSGSLLGRVRELVFKLTGIAPLFKRKLQREEADLIHAHFGPDGVMALPLARRLDLPLLVTFHGYDATTKDQYARQSFYRHRSYLRNRDRFIRKADGFIAVSQFIKRKMMEQGFPEEKIDVHYIGIDVDVFEPSSSQTREPVVLFVGRLVEKKGVYYLLRAMERVQKTHENVRLVIIGDGSQRAELEEETRRRDVSAEFLGFQPQEKVHEWMGRAMMLAAPSVTAESGDSEGLPMVVIEGQAMRLPVVASRHAGIPEAVLDGETGFLADEGDWETLAEHIQTLADDPDLRRSFGKRGRERVVEHFNAETQARKLDDLYRSYIHARSNSHSPLQP